MVMPDLQADGPWALFLGADLPAAVTGLPSRADLARALARRHGLDESLPLSEAAQCVGLRITTPRSMLSTSLASQRISDWGADFRPSIGMQPNHCRRRLPFVVGRWRAYPGVRGIFPGRRANIRKQASFLPKFGALCFLEGTSCHRGDALLYEV